MYIKKISSQHFSGGPFPSVAGDGGTEPSSALELRWSPKRDPVAYDISSCEVDGRGCELGLRLSFCNTVNVSKTKIVGGERCCVDVVRGGDVVFDKCEFISSGSKQHVIVRGGVKNISFVDCVFVNNYSNWLNGSCVDLGMWSDYDQSPRPFTKGVSIENCSMIDAGKGALARVFYSERPKVVNSPGKVIKVPSLFVAAFWALQRRAIAKKGNRLPAEQLKVYDIEL